MGFSIFNKKGPDVAVNVRKKWPDAIKILNLLRKIEPYDAAVKLSLVELLMESKPGFSKTCQRIVNLTEKVSNETSVHCALLFYRAKALEVLGKNGKAVQVLTEAFRKNRNRPLSLLRKIKKEHTRLTKEIQKA